MEVIEAIPRADAAIAAERIAVTAALPAHGHSFLELAVVSSGTGVHRTRSGERRIGPGEVVLIRPGQWHAYDDPEGLVVWNLYIAARTLTAELAVLRSDPLVAALVSAKIAEADGEAMARPAPEQRDGGQILTGTAARRPPDGTGTREPTRPPAARPEIIEPYLAALAAPPDGGAGDGLMRLGNLLVVLAHLVPVLLARSPGQLPRSPHPAVMAATDLLHADPARPWALPELARQVHLSAPHLCRCFVRDLGLSPLRYLERYRLELAAELLLASDLAISQISSRVGLADPNYLARRFRAAHGFTPSRYRAAFASAGAHDPGEEPGHG
jgi:AraC family L-rhamnose operon transcriptional activator RhaR